MLTELLERLRPEANDRRKYILDREKIGCSLAISDGWLQFLGEEALTLENASEPEIKRISQTLPAYLFMRGNLTLGAATHIVDLTFFTVGEEEEELGCLLLMNPNRDWKFSDSYPELPSFFSMAEELPQPSFLDDLDFDDFRFIYATHAFDAAPAINHILNQGAVNLVNPAITRNKEDIVKGLNFFGDFDRPSFSGALAFVNPLIQGVNLQDLNGFTAVQNGRQMIHLFVPILATKTVGGNFSIGVEGFELYTSTTNHFLSSSGVILYGGITAGNIEVEIMGELPLGGNIALVEAYLPNPLSINDFADLTSLTNESSLGDFLPMAADLLTSIGLRSVKTGIILSTRPGIAFLEFEIGVTNTFDFIEDVISLEDLSFSGRIDQPFSASRTFNFFMAATWELAGAKIFTSLDLVQGRFTGRLGPDESLSLANILESFFDFSTDQTIAIQDLEVEASKQGDYNLFVQLADLWNFEVGETDVALKRVTINVFGNKDTGVSGFVEAAMSIGSIDFSLLAAVPGGGSGWAFSGNTGAGQQIEIGELIAELANEFGVESDVPESIRSFSIQDIKISFNTGTKNFEFACQGNLEIEGTPVKMVVFIQINRVESSPDVFGYERNITGEITIADQVFVLHLSKAATSTSFMGVYSNTDGMDVGVSELIGTLAPDAAEVLPEISLAIKQVFFGYQKSGVDSRFLFSIDLDTNMGFNDLPLVGPLLPADATISVQDIQLLYAKGAWTIDQLSALGEIETGTIISLPQSEISNGGNVRGNINFGPKALPFDLSLAGKKAGQSTNNGTNTSSGAAGGGSGGAPAPGTSGSHPPAKPLPAPSSPGKWFNINKQLGPLNIARAGVNFADSRLWFMLDAEVTLGPLSLILEDLSFGSRIDRFDPAFNLRGFGLKYASGPVEVSGLFLRLNNAPGSSPVPGVTDQFAGAAVIKTSELTIAAIGEYAMVNGAPSFYLYAYLGFPIGGPAFFFVEGLALGFGFNRSVRIPPIDQITIHPLVYIATEGTDDILELAQALVSGNFVPIDPGSIFLAVGVRFTTFKLLDSFALIVVTFGQSFRLDILGRSKLVVPTPEAGKAIDPLAEVTLAFKGSFIPDEGFLGVQAQLTPDSYVLSRDCVLQGGFAFFTWFDPSPHAGDFVITLGGYHPAFKRPAHYPVVPRLGFNWLLTPQLTIKGGMYFALTPSAVMAGGRLEAVWKDGSLKAWFIIGADFIISWKPYFYDARVYLSMGISYTFWFFGEQTISFEIGVDLHIWGPEFSGVATIDLEIVSFEVEFGETALEPPPALKWLDFKKSFIPDSTISMAMASGLVKIMDDDVWIIDPKTFELKTDSIIPIKSTNFVNSPNALFGIGPMDKGADALKTSLHLTIVNDSNDDQISLFSISPILKAVPKALWGTVFQPGLNNKEDLIEDVLSGLRVTLNPPPEPDQMSWLEKDTQQFNIDNELEKNQFRWESVASFSDDGSADKAVTDQKRTDIFQELGLNSAGLFLIDEDGISDLDLAVANADLLVGQYDLVD